MKLFGVIVTIFVLCDVTTSSTVDSVMQNEWTEFKLEHKKTYKSSEEEQHRFSVFLDNREFVAKHNQRHAQGLETYDMGLNHLSDLTYEEVLQKYTNHGMPQPNVTQNLDLEADDSDVMWFDDDTPLMDSEFSWRKKLALGAVKNQQSCGSCWAFSVLTTLEHHLRIHKHVKVDLSEQQLVDCSRNYHNLGCNGGYMEYTFKYIADHGIAKESSYPYKAQDGDCKYHNNMRAVSIRGFKRANGEANMQRAVEQAGPLSASIHVSRKFMNYKSGIFNEPGCSQETNHAIVVIGHGVYKNHQYWIVQNSWGSSWGQYGFILMSKNMNKQCGIGTRVTYPVL